MDGACARAMRRSTQTLAVHGQVVAALRRFFGQPRIESLVQRVDVHGIQ